MTKAKKEGARRSRRERGGEREGGREAALAPAPEKEGFCLKEKKKLGTGTREIPRPPKNPTSQQRMAGKF